MVNLWCMEFTPSKTGGSLRHWKALWWATGIGLQTAKWSRQVPQLPHFHIPAHLWLFFRLPSSAPTPELIPRELQSRFHACSLPAYSACPHYSSSQQRGIHYSMRKTDSLQPFAYSSKPATTHRLCHCSFPPELFDMMALMNRGRNRGKEWNTNC